MFVQQTNFNICSISLSGMRVRMLLVSYLFWMTEGRRSNVMFVYIPLTSNEAKYIDGVMIVCFSTVSTSTEFLTAYLFGGRVVLRIFDRAFDRVLLGVFSVLMMGLMSCSFLCVCVPYMLATFSSFRKVLEYWSFVM